MQFRLLLIRGLFSGKAFCKGTTTAGLPGDAPGLLEEKVRRAPGHLFGFMY